MQEQTALPTSYASYVLRLRWQWQEDEWLCQIMLTSVMTGERYYFGSLERLLTFLQQQRPAGKGGP